MRWWLLVFLLGAWLMVSSVLQSAHADAPVTTVSVTMPTEDWQRLTDYFCNHPIWKFRAPPEACTQGLEAIVQAMTEKWVTAGTMGNIKGLADLHATVAVRDVQAP